MTKLDAGMPPDPGFVDGSVRVFNEEITLAAQASGDTIEVARLPKGAVPLFGMMISDTALGASATVAIGASGATGKYRAAALFNAGNTWEQFGLATAAGEALTAEETVIVTVGGAALPAAGALRVMFFYSFN
jgi:hypothetical protein